MNLVNVFKDFLGKVVPANGTSSAGKLDKKDWYSVVFNAGLVGVSAIAAYLMSQVGVLDFGGYDQMLVPVFVVVLKSLEKWAKDNGAE
jgi:hypothetical protein